MKKPHHGISVAFVTLPSVFGEPENISVILGKLNKKEWEGLRIDKISTDVLIMNFKRKFA